MEPEPTQLALAFAPAGIAGAGGRTVLARRHVAYPYSVTAPLRGLATPPDGVARVTVQSISGGLYRGERLGQRIEVAAGGSAVVTFPTATVVQPPSDGQRTRQGIVLQAAAGARLHYLNRPLILLPGAALEQSIDVVAAPDSEVLLRDGFLPHDPAGATRPFGRLDLSLAVREPAGRLLALDRAGMDGSLLDEQLPGVSRGYRAFGTLWLVRPLDEARRHRLEAAVFDRLRSHDRCYGAPSALPGGAGLAVRVAARDGGALDAALLALTGLLAAADDI